MSYNSDVGRSYGPPGGARQDDSGNLSVEPPASPKKKRNKNWRKMFVKTSKKTKLVGPDAFIPGRPYLVGPIVKQLFKVKPLRLRGVCVMEGCISPTAGLNHRALWCAVHEPLVRLKAKTFAARSSEKKKKAIRKKRKVRHELEKARKRNGGEGVRGDVPSRDSQGVSGAGTSDCGASNRASGTTLQTVSEG